MRCAEELQFLNYSSHKKKYSFIQNMTCEIYIRNHAIFPISIFSCQAAVKEVMSACPKLNLVQTILSCLAALTNPDVDLSWAKFSSSLVDSNYLSQPVKARFSQSEEVF